MISCRGDDAQPVKRNMNTTKSTDCPASFFIMQTNLLVLAESGKLKSSASLRLAASPAFVSEMHALLFAGS